MTDILDGLEILWISSITEVDRDEWNLLAKKLNFPFLEWDWLRIIEQSGSATPESGWLTAHLLVRYEGRLVGAAPLFVRDQSEGEFIFDRVWVEVSQKGGMPYYPKIVGMSPFTPASGYRFMVAGDVPVKRVTALICQTLDRFCSINGLGSCAFNFVDPDWGIEMEAYGYAAWKHQGYVWANDDFRDFDHWLGTLNSNRRKTVRRERKALRRGDVRVQTLTGYEIPDRYFDLMFRCYESTNDKFGVWSCKYLTPDFFERLKHDMRENLMFTVALRGDDPDPLALSMFVFSGDRLWGRYWGCFEEVRFLHFELCYYVPIEWAIANGINTYDPGMGGEHKARRGFFSTPSYSLHKFADPSMDLTFKTYIQEVNNLENGFICEMNDLMPGGRIEED